MPSIEIAESPGVDKNGASRPTEDRVIALGNAVVLLDGATASHPGRPSPAWYADTLAHRIACGLRADPDAPLADVLGAAIEWIRDEHRLTPRRAPSSTVAITRWTADRLDSLVLADSPIAVFGPSTMDTYEVLADDRLAVLRDAGRLPTVAAVDELRNTEGGFWVAEADPSAARHALVDSRPLDSVGAVALASDGVSAGVDDYGLFDWRELRESATKNGADAVLRAIRRAERGDPDRTRWPRGKVHDDQALAIVDFTR